MKIRTEHLEHMREHIAKLDTTYHRSRYAMAGLSDMRYRWDILRAAGLIPWVCKELYGYLNDNHIDTALRHIVKPLERQQMAIAAA